MKNSTLAISLAALVCASVTVNAQSAKTDRAKNGYFCSSGIAVFSAEAKPTKAQRNAANGDCYAEDKAQQEQQDRQMAEDSARLASLQKKDCQHRYKLRPDGTDDPVCAGIPPDYELIALFRAKCQDRPSLSFCGRLLPLPHTSPARKK
jgi:hypothetical protein